MFAQIVTWFKLLFICAIYRYFINHLQFNNKNKILSSRWFNKMNVEIDTIKKKPWNVVTFSGILCLNRKERRFNKQKKRSKKIKDSTNKSGPWDRTTIVAILKEIKRGKTSKRINYSCFLFRKSASKERATQCKNYQAVDGRSKKNFWSSSSFTLSIYRKKSKTRSIIQVHALYVLLCVCSCANEVACSVYIPRQNLNPRKRIGHRRVDG